jgi:hypothetical protein
MAEMEFGTFNDSIGLAHLTRFIPHRDLIRWIPRPLSLYSIFRAIPSDREAGPD